MNKLLNNFFYNSFYQILTIIVPLITTPYLTRTLGSSSLGISTYTLAIVTLYYTIGSLGIDMYAKREIAYVNASRGNIKTVFVELLISRLTLMVFTLIGYCYFINNNFYRDFFIIHIGTLVCLFLDVTWFFIGLEEMKSVVLRNIIIKLLSTLCIFLFVKTKDDLEIYIIIYVVAQIFSSFIMFPQIKKYLKSYKLERLNFKRHIKPIIASFLPQAASIINTQFDKVMIEMFSADISYVTIYEKAESIINLPLKFITALSAVILPRTSGMFINNENETIKSLLSKIMNLTIVFVFPAIIGLILVSDIFIPLYLGKEYIESINVLRLLGLATVAISFSNITGVQYLYAANKTKLLTISYMLCAIINCILNYLLIPIMNSNGAAIATVIAEWTTFVIQYCYMLKNNLSISISKNVKSRIIPIMFMICSVLFIRLLFKNSIVSGCLQIIIGIIVYTLCLVINKDEIFIIMWENLIGRLKKINRLNSKHK